MISTELRIGNYIFADPNADKYQLAIVSSLGKSIIGWDYVDRPKRMDTHHYIKPIPITEDWLMKFGFKIVHKSNNHFAIQDPNGISGKYMIHIFPTINDQWHIAFSDIISGKEISYSPTTKVKHVHSLQNLYFALTAEELIIKE